MVLRASDDPMALVPAIRVAVARLDPNLPLDNIQTFDDIRAGLFSERRLAMLTMLVFAGLTFTLSAIGLYGVISDLVLVRTREIGIRLAIGASRATICGDVLRSGATHAAGGIGLGAAGALALSQVVASKVPAMEGVTPALVAGLALAVGAGAIAATLTPALRASRVDPALTLRAE